MTGGTRARAALSYCDTTTAILRGFAGWVLKGHQCGWDTPVVMMKVLPCLLCPQAEPTAFSFHHRLHCSAHPVLAVPHLDGSCCQSQLLWCRWAEGEEQNQQEVSDLPLQTYSGLRRALCFSQRCPGFQTSTTLGSMASWSWCSPRLCPQTCTESSSWTRTSHLPRTSLSCGPSSTNFEVSEFWLVLSKHIQVINDHQQHWKVPSFIMSHPHSC